MNIVTCDLYDNVVSYETYPNNSLKSCILGSENMIQTKYGTLIPQYNGNSDGFRQKKYRSSIDFYKNGVMKSVALEKQLPIETPLGTFPAELVTFYDSGVLKRVFPSNGRIDGFWSEKDEGELCDFFDFEFSTVSFTSKIIGICFFESGAVRSITLWPGEEIEVTIKDQVYKVRNGISFYESGKIKSIEPAEKTLVKTSIGRLFAFNKDALGIHGDSNSLVFSEEGEVIELISTHSGVRVEAKDQETVKWFEPLIIDSITEFGKKTILPLSIKIDDEKVIFKDLQTRSVLKENTTFTTYIPMIDPNFSCSDCSTCSACHS
jgi:hypothetical protein